MKKRKNVSLSPKAIARGAALAAEQGINFSELIERNILSAPKLESGQPEDYWPGKPLKPIRKPGDRRSSFIQEHHR